MPAPQTSLPAASARREIVLDTPGEAVSAPEKPARITLASPPALAVDSIFDAPSLSSAARTPITLSLTDAEPPGHAPAAPMHAPVRLHDDGQGVWSIEIALPLDEPPTVDTAAALRRALERAQQEPDVRVLVLRGLEHAFVRGSRAACDSALSQGVNRALASFPAPVIAVLRRDAIGAAFLAASLCDIVVCNEEASYGFTHPDTQLYPSLAEARLFGARYGRLCMQDLLFVELAMTGAQLRAKGWSCSILPPAQIEPHVQQLTADLAAKVPAPLRLLKQDLLRDVAEALADITPVALHGPVDEGTGVVRVLTIEDGLVSDLLRDVRAVLAGPRQPGPTSTLLLVIDAHEPRGESPSGAEEDALLELCRLVLATESPVVVALPRGARSQFWLLGQCCDACVYSRDDVYSWADLGSRSHLWAMAADVVAHRLGSAVSKEIMLTGADYTGRDLEYRLGAIVAAARGDVVPTARRVAETWTRLPADTLAAWKRHTATVLQGIHRRPLDLAESTGDDASEPLPSAPTRVPLSSSVVTVTAHPDGIVVVQMEERAAKNALTDPLLDGLVEAFAHIAQTPAYKVVVLTGYDSYFSSGGTRDTLLAIHAGQARFTDRKTFQVALDCPLPVIAAVQGHAVGAGWSMALFADVVVLSEESRYASPYLDYGFTPAAGATYILAKMLGSDLARESLLTARPYVGREFRARGVRLQVRPPEAVYPASMAVARQMTQRSRRALIGLKQCWTTGEHAVLDDTYRRELAMHAQTFVGQAAARAQIDRHVAGIPESSPAGGRPTAARGDEQWTAAAVADEAAMTRRLKALLAAELQMREDEIDDQAPFVDLGLDSISGVAWIRKINDTYRTAIEATRVYSYPTLAQFSRYVTEEAERSGTLPAAAPPRSVDGRAARISASANLAAADVTPLKSRRRRAGLRVRSDAPAASRRPTIAVIGMAGQFPQARTLDAFWQNLAEGRNCISEVSPDRWDVRAYYQPGAAVAGKTNSRWMGALEDYDRFDPLFFNISPSEAESMDPQQRLFLQACWHAIEDACYDARGLSASKCGVFVGCTTGDYHQRWRVHELNAHRFTGSASSILAARIAYFLNLQGACLAIDTACSSSLVAVAQACDSLSARDSDLALAGGVYVMAGPEMHIRTAQAGMLSAEGRCFTFDRRADGFVPGEAVGVVMLKRLDDAVKDRDLIYGVIEGWGVNQDGRTNGITAPNPESQVRLEQDVYDKYGIDPASIQLVEAHGTATKLGDPIEVEGLKTAFRKYTDKREYCALGSVKSNIGHCLTAAGIAGVIKVLLALRHERIPPTINFEEMNDRVDLSDSPFYVNTRLRPWELNGATRRRGAISSFGFSGTNAHLVIGDYRPGVEPVAGTRSAGTPAIVLLSAATAAQLRQKAQDLLDLLEQGPVALDDLAYTLQVGRQPMDERFGVVVHAVDELVARLRAYVRGDMQIAAAAQGRVTRTPVGIGALTQDPEVTDTLIASCIAKQKLSALVQLWVTGVDVDWRRLYGASTPRRMRLPLYPFARERYWIDAPVSTHETSSHLLAPAPAAGTLLAIPTWRRSDLAPGITASEAAYVEQHVVVCGMAANDAPALQAAMPHVRVLMLTADTNQTLADRYAAYGRTCFEHIAGIVRNQPAGRVLVQVVVADEPAHAVLAGLSSLLKSAALERPYLAAQLLLVAADTRSETLAGYLAGEARGGMEPLIRYGRDGRHVMRWEEIMAGEAPSVRPFEAGGVYLITGGLGALGRLFAGEILRQAQRSHVILTGRSALTAERRARLRAVTTEADRVSYRQVDLGDLDQVRRLIAAVGEEHGRLDGILHSAGMVADALIENKAGDDFDAVLAPKVSGTFNLDRASESVDLAFFVLFSSVAAVLGNPGQADYATANGFLDWFASYRNRLVAAGERRGRTRSINWPLWEVGGLRMDSAIQALLHQTTGIQPMQTAVGLQTFYRSLALSGDRMLVLAGDLPRIRTYLHAACLFDRPSSPRTPTPDSVTGRDAAARISIDQLVQRLKAIVAATLRIEERLVEVDRPFVELGVDSFIGAELVLAINGAFGTALSHTALFNHPTIAELSRILQHEIETLPDGAFGRPGARLDVTSAPPAGAPAVLTTRIDGRVPAASDDRQSDEQIAIVGMSGRYPQAESLDQYWSNLVEGRNSIVEVPASRWDVNRYYDPDRSRKGKTNSKWLGALDDVDCFDPLFFRISPHEAAYMDPQHRLFLQESYKAFEHAGYSGAALRNTKCGVYLGISTNEYMALVSRTGAESSPVTSHSNAIAAARIAYYLNLKGPAIAIDTACSSSLVAIHLGSQALVSGEIDMALAGGVTLWLVSDSYVSMSQAGMFSPSGQCKAFDDTADGIVNGDGVGVVVLKRLRDARRDNDVIYGVILGSGINQDGRTNGITAPSISSQIDLQRDVYTKHGIDPDTIGYVETHGTGTRLGDPIELEALSTVFRERTARRRYCGLGSVKSNIGHTTAAAGVAGLHKVLLSMQHRTLVPTLNVTRETTRFDFESSPFYLVRETKPWEVDPGARRRAAVNSFGFSGTNAHLVVEEYQPPAGRTTLVPRTGPFIVPLSARTPEQLQQRARDLLTYVSACSPDSKRDHSTACSHPLDLADLAYTFQVGREAMEERLALVVSSVPELSARVKAFVDCEQTIVGAYRGRVEPGEQAGSLGRHNGHPAAAGSHTQDDLAALAASWVVGAEIDWNRLYGDSLPRRIGLPTYPFAKERYWLEERATDRAANGRFDLDGDPEWIDDIVDRICDDAISAGDAVAMLRAGVQRLSTDVECN
jgi:acyl transferase domain-containing protein/enoyl-CoA hydratase/carnithine racemase/acyl carrier protein